MEKHPLEGEVHPDPSVFAEALACHRAGRLDQAEAAYLAYLDALPDHFPSLCNLGLLYLGRQEPARAVPFFELALAVNPDSAESRIGLMVALQQCGRREEAVEAARAALALRPEKAEIYSDMSILLRELGRPEEAVQACRDAIARKPDYVEAHNHLGNALADLERWDEAIAAYQAAITLKPDGAEAWGNLGGVFNAIGRHSDALAACQKAIALKPDLAAAYNNLGNALLGLRRFELAARALSIALRLKPDSAESHANLALALEEMGQLDQAETECRQAFTLNPRDPSAHNNLSHILKELGRLDEAEAECRVALTLRPGFAPALSSLGTILTDQGRMEEALACFAAALKARPDYPEALSNLSHTLKSMGRIDEAAAAASRAITVKPDLIEAHVNLAFASLLKGDFEQGWHSFEWRWSLRQNALHRRAFTEPEWQGEPLEGRTLLLYPEQGLGDMLQFCRYAKLARARGGRVVLETYAPLVRLFSTLDGVDQVVSAGGPLPRFDCQRALMSLPRVMGTTLANIPADIPYLAADPAETETWRQRFVTLPGLKVGLVWAGEPRPHDVRANAIDKRRSIEPERLVPLLSVPGMTWISLQMGAGARKAETLPERMRPVEVMDGVKDFADTAAIVAALDLVVTVDTSVVHLAGALGKPVWLLSRFDGCWRWLTGREDSPWYPTLRLFRQPAPDAWEIVVDQVAAALGEWAKG